MNIIKYRVKWGDTLSELAVKYHTTVKEIQQLNADKIKDVNFILAEDWILKIPNNLPAKSAKTNTGANKADSVNATFSTKPQQSKQGCPSNKEIAIFPVRYAIDEEIQRGDIQKHTIPEDWGTIGLPEINERQYAMRQLRDGWLYVWDGKKFDEYLVKNTNFKHTNRQDKKVEQTPIIQIEPSIGKKGSNTYIKYKALNKIYLCYAQERWTERLYELMQDNKNNERKKWMREFDLPMLCQGIQPHTQLIEKISDYVADIYKDTIPPEEDFTTTTVHTVEPTDITLEPEIKPAELQAKIVGAVPEKESAYFISLDDHLGILRDLNMELAGLNASALSFDENHQHKLHVASIIQNLCTPNIPLSDYPASVNKDDQTQVLEFRMHLGKCYEKVADINYDNLTIDTGVVAIYSGLQYLLGYETTSSEDWALTAVWKEDDFKQKYPDLTFEWFTKHYSSWDKIKKSRNTVKYDEAIAYLEKTKERETIITRLETTAQDLRAYFEFMGCSPEVTQLDHCDVQQSALLITAFSSLHIELSKVSTQIKPWLAKDLIEKQTLISLISYNFNKELAEKIEKMLAYYLKHKKLEKDEPSFDVTGILTQIVAGGNVAFNSKGAYETASSEKELQAASQEKAKHIIDVKRIKNTNTFKEMSATAQNAFDVIPEAVIASPDTWDNLQKSIFYRTDDIIKIAKNTNVVGSVNLMHTIIYSKISGQYVYFYVSEKYLQEFDKWMSELGKLETEISKREAILAQTGETEDNKKPKTSRKKRGKERERDKKIKRNARYELGQSYENGKSLRVRLQEHQAKMPAIFKLVLSKDYLQQSGQGIYRFSQIVGTDTVDKIDLHYLQPSIQNSAQAGIFEQLRSSVGIIGAALVALNFVNCIYSIGTKTGGNNDAYNLDDIEGIISSQAYLANLLLTFETNQLWGKMGGVLMPTLLEKTNTWVDKKLVILSNKSWKDYWGSNTKGLQAFKQDAGRFFTIARTMAVFGIIANVVEGIQIFSNKAPNANSTEEKVALYIKGISNYAMAVGFGFQLATTYIRGSWLAFAFGPWFAWGMAIISVIYMAASYFASLFHYEGFDLWCKRCVWTKEKHYWNEDDQGRKEEMAALYQIMLAPQVYYVPTFIQGYKINDGFQSYDQNQLDYRDMNVFLYIQMPALPTNAQAQITIEFPYKETRTLRDPVSSTSRGLVGSNSHLVSGIRDQLVENQSWLTAKQFSKEIYYAIGRKNAGIIKYDDFMDYLANQNEDGEAQVADNAVWASDFYVSQFRTNTTLQLEVKYPHELLEPRNDNKGYLVEIYNPIIYPADANLLGTTEENEMESSKQGIKPKKITMLVGRSPIKFSTLPVLPSK